MDILTSLADLSDERLAEYAAEVRAAFDALVENDSPTEAQVTEAEGYAEHLDVIAAEQEARVAAATALADRTAALRSRFSNDEAEAEAETEPEAEPDEEPEPEQPAQASVTEDAVPAAAAGTVATLSRKVARPVAPAQRRVSPITITAAADVPEFSTGSQMEDLGTVALATINRMRGFSPPTGDGKSESLQKFGVASFRLDFPKELTIDRHSDDMEVLAHAMKESRLPGNSLTAAGGWCAPSETIYDLCAGETAEGILSVPEVNVSRGGIRYTSGPDFSAIYTNTGFCQTEAQAIAGTAKTCYEVPCPPFTEVRLDACGICIKAPILTQAAYPELVQRWISGSMIAHQHKMNAKVIAAIVTAAGASKTVTALGTTAGDTLGSLELIADGIRSKYRLSQTHTMEVVLPFWAKGAIRSDLGLRTGQAADAVTDQQVNAHFAARHLAVSFVYDWQDTPFPAGTAPAVAYPANVQALIYPAGTFIKGTADVINLNAVYDAASLATNVYTALFFEQGILVAKTCYEAALVTVPVCNAGETGAADLACA